MIKWFSKPKTLLVVSLILTALVVSYLYAITSKPEIDEAARQAAPGSFISLSNGIVHYHIAGPESARTVVLVHGLATPYIIWDNNFQALVNAGFRVLRYDLYGRGFSDRPAVTYDRNLYDEQLLELLQQLDIESPVFLVGESMGGGVATIFADRHPDLVAKLALIAPVGFPVEESLAIKLAKVPVLGDYLMAVFGDRVILAGVKEAFVDPENLPQFEEKFKVQLQYAGLQQAILSTLRHMDMNGLSETYQRVGRQQKPVLLLWGDKDQVLPFANSEKVKQAIPHLEFHEIAGAGHNLGYEFSDTVNPLLLDFLSP
jgi:pimeloyl-ACP methyl ester carboxylesterase